MVRRTRVVNTDVPTCNQPCIVENTTYIDLHIEDDGERERDQTQLSFSKIDQENICSDSSEPVGTTLRIAPWQWGATGFSIIGGKRIPFFFKNVIITHITPLTFGAFFANGKKKTFTVIQLLFQMNVAMVSISILLNFCSPPTPT